ncbi:histidine containing phosphotransmitter protein [Saccharata proteae CBS 121410]|uniref:Histidine containing phosphotransmitter protein n=1 Tax=Saccharata proteae CBS 121410 TaxID=1314787 RepID=A0A9P4LX61_9PEZI|nr:histidine containing phosphotransmitter protein [Saccharata proteae CBS 121410]
MIRQSEEGSTGLPEAGDAIDTATFEQILEMDDDEDEREFSKSIVFDFFQQADSTFKKMDTALEEKDLNQLSQLGHFLKGSSATLGLTKVKDSCEKIQHFGANKDETGTHDEPDDEVCLKNLKKIIEQAKTEFRDVEKVLKKFYHDEAPAPAPAPAPASS